MRSSSLFFYLALALALPVTSSSLLPRSHVCANDGVTIAGTLFNRRDASFNAANSRSLQPRVQPQLPCFFCCPFSTTYIMVQSFIPNLFPQGLNPLIINALTTAWSQVRDHISVHGDGVIPGGEFDFRVLGYSWYSINSNNHQQTWGVVKSALSALLGFMHDHEEYGMATFVIFDGTNEVGTATFGPNL